MKPLNNPNVLDAATDGSTSAIAHRAKDRRRGIADYRWPLRRGDWASPQDGSSLLFRNAEREIPYGAEPKTYVSLDLERL